MHSQAVPQELFYHHWVSEEPTLKNARIKTASSPSSSAGIPMKSDVPGSGECTVPPSQLARVSEGVVGEIPIAEAESSPVPAATSEKRSSPEDFTEMETDERGEERAARRSRLALIEQMVLQLHGVTGTEMDDDPGVEPELILREEDWEGHDKDEGNFDPEMVALEK